MPGLTHWYAPCLAMAFICSSTELTDRKAVSQFYGLLPRLRHLSFHARRALLSSFHRPSFQLALFTRRHRTRNHRPRLDGTSHEPTRLFPQRRRGRRRHTRQRERSRRDGHGGCPRKIPEQCLWDSGRRREGDEEGGSHGATGGARERTKSQQYGKGGHHRGRSVQIDTVQDGRRLRTDGSGPAEDVR